MRANPSPIQTVRSGMLSIGSNAPAIILPDQDGTPYHLATAWARGPVVLFFYPKADSLVCTKEACAFRDAYADLQAHNATIVGISRDGTEAQKAFAERWQLPFVLLSDKDGVATKAYKATGLFGLMPGRVTYVIDSRGIIFSAHDGLLQSDAHVQSALKALDAQSTA